ncbi:LysR family transcriptional regulator [Marinobacter sp. ANT_B65]|uniref:LysR family transcriptional regulator n=1 Tax=Marinobacter sp. ANT_B65 TaxID=2039467 RepID=UPI0015CBA49A|nr:LysR family transcriptional regulator [Marinobacter sp. ANT_B65]
MSFQLKIDLRQLNTFMTITETGSFSRASEKLFVAQPALSRQIRLMEESLNAEVFVRHGRGVVLTAAGEVLYEKTLAIFQDLERAQAAVAATAGEVTGQIILGMLPTASNAFSGSIISEFRRKYPRVRLSIKSAMSGTLQQLVSQHRVDLAVTYNHSKHRHVQYSPLIEERFFLIAPPTDKLARRRSISLEEVLELPLVMPEEKHGLRELMEKEAVKHQKKLQLAIEVNAWPLLTDLIKRGLGYTVLSYASVYEMVMRKEVVAIPIDTPELHRSLAIAIPRDLPPSLATLKLAEIIMSQVTLQVADGLWEGRPLFGENTLSCISAPTDYGLAEV